MSTPTIPVRLRALARAKSYLGVREQPNGSNRGPLIDGWNQAAGVPVGSAWCMAFLRAMFYAEGVTLGGWASVGFFEEWATKNGDLVTRPFKGDLVCYDWNGDGWPDHVGIVERVLALRWRGRIFVGWIQTIEGNTGSPEGVWRCRRWATSCKFARVKTS